jgi:hypothetical protein
MSEKQTGKGASDDDLTFDSPNRWTKSDRPLSERVRYAERGSDWWDDPLSNGFDEFDSSYLADEIAALEAEIKDRAGTERSIAKVMIEDGERIAALEAERDRLRLAIQAEQQNGRHRFCDGSAKRYDPCTLCAALEEGGDDE